MSAALYYIVLSCVLLAMPLLAINDEPQSRVATIGPGAQIVPPPPGYRFPNGQTYVFGVEWHFFNAGIARVRMEPAGAQQKVAAQADSIGVVNTLYGIHDRFEAYFDPRTFCSQRVVKHSEEGQHKRDTQVRFDYAHRSSVLDEKNLKTGETKHTDNDIPTCVTDVVTGFYYLAAQPLQLKNSYRFPINDGGKTTEVRALVEAEDQVKVPAGTFQTVRVVAEPTIGPLKGKGKVWVWFTNDANRTPVQMRAKLGWGTLLFRLQRVEK
jgi:hypothetical protein